MNTLQAAAQQALAALETKGEHHPRVYRAIEALRAALEQPEMTMNEINTLYVQAHRATPANYGWVCPACGSGNAPFTQRCPCKGWPKMEITC